MAISELPILSLLRTKMQWHQERQRLLAENVANADMPQFKPRDLVAPSFASNAAASPAAVTLTRTDASHQTGSIANTTQFKIENRGGFEVRPSGNAVNLEDEMLKVAANQIDYQTATSLYSRSLDLIKIALGKK
jgi:flagellar basal-body rod protein FlgB